MPGHVRYLRYLLIAGAVLIVFYTFQTYVLTGRDVSFGPTGEVIPKSGSKSLWRDIPVRFPVKRLTPLPTGKPLKLARVQHNFPLEDESAKNIRLKRRQAVKDAFTRAWTSYKQHAWMADELAPISGGKKDHFGGWSATLVDSFDTLWIMDMKDEFEHAVAAAVSIDFGASTLQEVNVFETTIRYLGGFLAGYDLSGEQRLLDKAIELGDMLIAAFDTPNRMPVMRWRLQNAKYGRPQTALSQSLVAEIGSLEMEFTRLSQLTGDNRFYDATDRIMRVFETQQDTTKLPGMWPIMVDAERANFARYSGFTLGAMADSLYEYFPKMHALLGGLDPKYEKMYRKSMTTAYNHTMFKPMTPHEADILISGHVEINSDGTPELEHQGQHLVCFAGGMYALGGRLFNDPHHVETGRKLTDGCIWAYKSMPIGIMPEVFHTSHCPSLTEPCPWSDAKWHTDVVARKDPGQPASAAHSIIIQDRLREGYIGIKDRRYILRPEAIESVFIMYRITGEKKYLESAWEMWTAIDKYTRTPLANGALRDVTVPPNDVVVVDSMESFWLAETLKVCSLAFDEIWRNADDLSISISSLVSLTSLVWMTMSSIPRHILSGDLMPRSPVRGSVVHRRSVDRLEHLRNATSLFQCLLYTVFEMRPLKNRRHFIDSSACEVKAD